MKSMMTDIDSISKDLSGSLKHYIDRSQFDAERLSVVRDRLDLINHLKNRYKNSISGILSYAEQLSGRIRQYTDYSENRNALAEQLKVSARIRM